MMVQQFILRVSHDYGAAVISLEYHKTMVQQFIIRILYDYGAAVYYKYIIWLWCSS